MTCFQNESHFLCDACIVYIEKEKLQIAFSTLCFFLKLKVMFRYHFLGHFLAELHDICCGSLLNSILKKRAEGNFFEHSDFFSIQQNLKFGRILCVFFNKKNYLKCIMQHKYKRFCKFLHLHVFYVCATFHCIWRSGFKVICTLVSALNSKMAAVSMETKHGEKNYFVLSPYFFILIIINVQWNEWVEKWANSFSTSTSPRLYISQGFILARLPSK